MAAQNLILYYENYTPVGDVLVMATCMVFIILIHTGFINRTKNFLYLRDMIVLLFFAAMSDILYHVAMNYIGQIPNLLIYLPRACFHLLLFGNLWLYMLYARKPLRLERAANRHYLAISTTAFVLLGVWEMLGTFLRVGFYIDRSGEVHPGIPAFPIGYFFYVILMSVVIIRFRDRVIKQVVFGIGATIGISVLVMTIQQIYGQSSYTVATFLFPIYALLYLVHSNPYDLEIGTINENAFDELIINSYEQKNELLLMSLFMRDFDGSGRKYPREIHGVVRTISTQFFKGATLFQISSGHMILAADTAKNPDYNARAQKLLDVFGEAYPKFRLDYKLVFTKTYNKISAQNDYVGFIHYLHEKMPENSLHRADKNDVRLYLEHKYIVKELADIHAAQDMDDPRVEVYCQPVYNIRTKTYDTAEALMRLRLPETGLVSPDCFIPIAENYKYIHTLTRIILRKTCRQIRLLLENGYNVRRISVNFSTHDVREEDFTATVERIIRESGVTFDKIAIEITESQNEQDFELVKEKMNELKDSGIKFYLDDFGTGYSNFERIMELPFDIIKFDRSLVTASSNDSRMQAMITHMARMFSDMDYAVLYEGVESEEDEARCVGMCAKYLQGFKYSRPIPIERLTDFFEKKAV
ncbi:MAG: EAL domain-containing protein [Lachnospiraceae bacterium]|nr:EAL domain-containing protein [Lachnospiraceae bacterium]